MMYFQMVLNPYLKQADCWSCWYCLLGTNAEQGLYDICDYLFQTLIQCNWKGELGAGGTAPPDPDGAAVQKAQYICALWQNISYFI